MPARQPRSITLLALLTLACASPPEPPPPPEDPSVVARFRGGEVSLAEVDAYLEAKPASSGEGTDAATGGDARIQPVVEIAARKALAAEAAALADPAFAARVEAAAQKAGDAILLEAMIERRGWTDPELSPDELAAYYETHPEFYAEPRRARLQHIFLRAETGVVPAAEREETRLRLEALRQEALDGADFTALARQHSQSATAASGGFMSINAESPLPREFSAAVWSLPVNGVSEAVDTGNGFHLIHLKQIYEPVRRSFEESQEHLRRMAGKAKVRELQEQLIREAGPRYGVDRTYDRLSADPESAEPVVLIRHRDGAYTLSDLLNDLPDPLQEQLFQGYLPNVHQVLDQVTANQTLILEAKAEKLEEDPGVGGRISAMMKDIRYQAALQRRLELAVAALPESAMREYFDQNAERYQTLKTWDLTVIHLDRRPGESMWQTLKRGEGLVAQVRGGEDMESLARQHSRHYSAAGGGRLRYFTDGGVRTRVQATAKFRRQLQALSPGEIAAPFLAECYDAARLRYLPTGVLIVRLDAVHEPVPQTYEVMSGAVRQNYLRRHHQRLVAEVRQQVGEEIGLEIFADRLPPI